MQIGHKETSEAIRIFKINEFEWMAKLSIFSQYDISDMQYLKIKITINYISKLLRGHVWHNDSKTSLDKCFVCNHSIF